MCVLCVLHTLTLKVSIVPSSSWTRQSRSGFGMSVTTVTLPPSQDKHPALSSSLSGDLETHIHTHTDNHKNSVRCFQPVVFQWKHLPQDDTVWWVIYCMGCIGLQWVMRCECEGVTVVCVCVCVIPYYLAWVWTCPFPLPAALPLCVSPPFAGSWMIRMLNIFRVEHAHRQHDDWSETNQALEANHTCTTNAWM